MPTRPHTLRSNHRSKHSLDKQTAFLQAYIRTGKILGAARIANIPRSHHYMWNDPETGDADYRKRFALAQKIIAASLYDEAYRRAVEGVEKPLLYKGQPVATIREYSDSLLALLIKAHDPETFTTRHHVTGNINVTAMPFRLDELKPESQRAILEILEADLGERKELVEARGLLEAQLLAPEDDDDFPLDPFEEDNPLIEMIPRGDKGNWSALQAEAEELGLALPASRDWRPLAPAEPSTTEPEEEAQEPRGEPDAGASSRPPASTLSGLDPGLWLPPDGTEDDLLDPLFEEYCWEFYWCLFFGAHEPIDFYGDA